MSGFNDAYENKIKLKDKDVEELLNKLDAKVTSRKNEIENKLKARIKGKKYELLPGGIYMVVDKKGKEAFRQHDVVTFNISEKHLDGKPILNTMNSKLINDQNVDPMMGMIIKSGLKGGVVTIYGPAGALYQQLPAEMKTDTLISITFSLLTTTG